MNLAAPFFVWEGSTMPNLVRRRKAFLKQLLTIILLSVLAGIIGGGLVGITTSHHPQAQEAEGSNT
jgi:hypothetical protein